MQYFVAMIDFGRNGRQALVDPEYTRGDVLDIIREKLGDGLEIAFVHHVRDGSVEDITSEIVNEARALMVQAAE